MATPSGEWEQAVPAVSSGVTTEMQNAITGEVDRRITTAIGAFASGDAFNQMHMRIGGLDARMGSVLTSGQELLSIMTAQSKSFGDKEAELHDKLNKEFASLTPAWRATRPQRTGWRSCGVRWRSFWRSRAKLSRASPGQRSPRLIDCQRMCSSMFKNRSVRAGMEEPEEKEVRAFALRLCTSRYPTRTGGHPLEDS